jgi:hypothetical protein
MAASIHSSTINFLSACCSIRPFMGIHVNGIIGILTLIADIWAIVSTFQSGATTGKKFYGSTSRIGIKELTKKPNHRYIKFDSNNPSLLFPRIAIPYRSSRKPESSDWLLAISSMISKDYRRSGFNSVGDHRTFAECSTDNG